MKQFLMKQEIMNNYEFRISRRARSESNERLWARPGKVAFARDLFIMVLICSSVRYIMLFGTVDEMRQMDTVWHDR